MSELKLSQMPLLEYNLKRYALNLAKRLKIAQDIVLEKWDEWVDRELTYIENKERVKRALLNLAKFEEKAETKEFLNELRAKEGEDLHRQIQWFIETIYSILNGDTSSEFYQLAESTGILEHKVSSLLKEIENFKQLLISSGFVKQYSDLFTELNEIEKLIKVYLNKYGNTAISGLTDKIEELEEITEQSKQKTKEVIEEVEITLKPIIVEKKGKLEEWVSKSKVVGFEVGNLTESELLNIAKEIESEISKSLKCRLDIRYNMLKRLNTIIKKLVNSGNFESIPELWYAIWRYKSVILPLSVVAGERQNYDYLSKVKCPLEVVKK